MQLSELDSVFTLKRKQKHHVLVFVCVCACAVGVHTDGGGQSSGQDFRFCIFKVGTSFSLSNLLEVSMAMMMKMIVLQALSVTSDTAVQTLCPTGRPVPPCLSIHCRYRYNSDTRCLCVWWPPTFLLTFSLFQAGTTSSAAASPRRRG